jgi:Tfp pilus assembly major pilin PilA
MNATKQRFRTLDSALTRIEELEAAGDFTQLKAQVTSLTAELAAKNAEIKILKAAAAGQQTAPAPTQAPATPPAAERPLAEMSKQELADAMDAANARGDKATTDRLWREYSARK